MGSYERNKGRRNELKWAKYVGGKRANDEGLPGIDVTSPPVTVYPPFQHWEVKVLAKLPALLRKWMLQMTTEGADAVVFREDNGEWWVMFRAERLDR